MLKMLGICLVLREDIRAREHVERWASQNAVNFFPALRLLAEKKGLRPITV
jgi:hypothetical protein